MALSRNLLLNLLGHALPLAGALLAIPVLTSILSPERFGFLSLAFVIIGYFGIFDIGIGRALTQLIASRVDTERAEQIPAIIHDGLSLIMRFALAATVLALAAIPWIPDWLNLAQELRAEADLALALLALSLLASIPLSALRGILEGFNAFATLTKLRIPTGLYSYLAPTAAVWFSDNLGVLMAVLLLGRGVSTWLHWRALQRLYPLPAVADKGRWNATLLGYGGWMTVSNVIAPLLTYLDRFVVSLRVSLAAVGWYNVPADVLSRAAIVPAAVMGVFFPAFSHALQAEPDKLRGLFLRSHALLIGLLLPPLLLIGYYAEPLLSAWLNPAFASHAAPVAQWLCLGVMLSALGQPAFHLLQAAGRARLTALLHLAQLLPYIGFLWWLSGLWGLSGAAIAWVVRHAVSDLILNILAWSMVLRHARPLQGDALHDG
jgi:O-antigen/teichoic acid export membrane protein